MDLGGGFLFFYLGFLGGLFEEELGFSLRFFIFDCVIWFFFIFFYLGKGILVCFWGTGIFFWSFRLCWNNYSSLGLWLLVGGTEIWGSFDL